VVAHIARAGGDAPLMLLVTTRDDGPFIDDAFAAFLGRLARLPSVEIVSLSGLDVAAATTLIGAVDSGLDPGEAVRQTGGNPLFLQELAREGPGSRSLRELVADRFNQLSVTDLDVLDVAAVAGEQIDGSLLACALDRPVDEVLDALERAETTGLIGAGARPGVSPSPTTSIARCATHHSPPAGGSGSTPPSPMRFAAGPQAGR
jgi:hypothetical protein